MRTHRHRRRHNRSATGNLKDIVSRLRGHPVRAACFGGLGLLLFWLVVSKSLPYALAPSDPELALALNPNNPDALIAEAYKARAQLLAATKAAAQTLSKEGKASADTTIDGLPEANADEVVRGADELEEIRREIRGLAIRAIANDPLNAEAFGLLATTADSLSSVRTLMQEAVKRSRRHPVALLWLLNDRYYHRDFGAATTCANLLFRTHPELGQYALSYLALIAQDPEGTQLLIQELAKAPAWRASFFAALPQQVKGTDTPLKLMVALQENGTPPTNRELSPYLNFLIGQNQIDAAYNVWLQFLPTTELGALGLLTNPNFDRDPTGLAFDWKIAQGINSVAEFVSLGAPRDRALHLSFSGGRVRFPEVSQIVFLPAGKYRLEGKLRGSIIGKRGLQWQLRCTNGARVLGETDMLTGQTQEWRNFTMEAEVPQTEDCRGQTLRLFHDSRSASEELLSGESWFANLNLEHILDPANVRLRRRIWLKVLTRDVQVGAGIEPDVSKPAHQ